MKKVEVICLKVFDPKCHSDLTGNVAVVKAVKHDCSCTDRSPNKIFLLIFV